MPLVGSEETSTGNGRYVQFGCGWSAPMEWHNYDSSPTLRFERIPLIGKLYIKNKSRFPNNVMYGDIVKGLPVSPGSCKGVYCSHILEHLSLDDFRSALLNTKKIMRPGAVFRLVLPDIEHSIKLYSANHSSTAVLDFMRETSLGCERRPRGLKGIVTSWLGNSAHFWMWDYKSIELELTKAGFVEIRRASHGDSDDPMFSTVEAKNRWDNCLGVECKMPS